MNTAVVVLLSNSRDGGRRHLIYTRNTSVSGFHRIHRPNPQDSTRERGSTGAVKHVPQLSVHFIQ